MLIWDGETGPVSEERLKELLPPFDPDAVKCGNLKDPDKIAAKIEEARANHMADFINRAALSPVTGRILVIGCYAPTKNKISLIEGDEEHVLTTWWKTFTKMVGENREMIGHNIFGFDLPFLVKRSRILKVDVPSAVYSLSGRYVNWNKLFVDTRTLWQMGDNQCESSLDLVSRAFGCGAKPDDVGGADFARLYHGTAEERAKAIEYLVNDLKMTAGVADALYIS